MIGIIVAVYTIAAFLTLMSVLTAIDEKALPDSIGVFMFIILWPFFWTFLIINLFRRGGKDAVRIMKEIWRK